MIQPATRRQQDPTSQVQTEQPAAAKPTGATDQEQAPQVQEPPATARSDAGAGQEKATPPVTQEEFNAANMQTGLATSDTPSSAEPAPAPVPAPTSVFPNINDPVPPKRWHSKTNRATFVELPIDEMVFLRDMNGSVKVLARDAFEDQFAQVGMKSRVVGPFQQVAECFQTPRGGVIILDQDKTLFFETKDAAVTAGYQVQ